MALAKRQRLEKKRRNWTKWEKSWILQREAQRAFPFCFCFSSHALIHSAERPISVIFPTSGFDRRFYLLSRPKSCRHGPTSDNCVDTQHQLGCSQTALIFADRWPGMSGPWSASYISYTYKLRHVSPSYLNHYFCRSLSSFFYFMEIILLTLVQCSGFYCPARWLVTVTERLEGVHIQRGTHWSLLHSNKQKTLCWIFMTLRAPRWWVWRWTGGKTCRRERITEGRESCGRSTHQPPSAPSF